MEVAGYQSNKRQLILEIQQAELEGLKRTGKRIVKNARRRVRKNTHALEKSIEMKGQPKRGADGTWELEIGSDLPYAGAQEFGRRDLPHYGFTPYLSPAFDEEAPGLAADINELVDR